MNATGYTPLKVLVVDDEALARSRVVALLGECLHPLVTVVGQAAHAKQAMDMLQAIAVDVVLLDIHMPGMDGVALARALRSLPRPPAVVFVTAHAEHAVQAFEVEALDYLTKPVRLERLQQALEKASRLQGVPVAPPPDLTPDEALLIQDRNRVERVPLSSVLYFKAELKYITVRTVGRSYILDGSLNDLEDRYHAQFFRIHRNALVARRAARALERHYDAEEGEGWALRLNGVDDLLQVSRRQVSAVRDMLAGVG